MVCRFWFLKFVVVIWNRFESFAQTSMFRRGLYSSYLYGSLAEEHTLDIALCLALSRCLVKDHLPKAFLDSRKLYKLQLGCPIADPLLLLFHAAASYPRKTEVPSKTIKPNRFIHFGIVLERCRNCGWKSRPDYFSTGPLWTSRKKNQIRNVLKNFLRSWGSWWLCWLVRPGREKWIYRRIRIWNCGFCLYK